MRNSFYTGLTATEFFMHTMAGREVRVRATHIGSSPHSTHV